MKIIDSLMQPASSRVVVVLCLCSPKVTFPILSLNLLDSEGSFVSIFSDTFSNSPDMVSCLKQQESWYVLYAKPS